MRRSLVALAVMIALTALAACGGKSKPKIGTTAGFVAKAGLLGGSQSAGTVPSYVPTGKIVADSGFRPGLNGFGFENYGNDAGPVNLTPANVEDIFGPQVCAEGDGSSCVLIPSAKGWMEEENQAMATGHCMGFSVTALRFFTGNLSPSTYGASSTPTLPIQGNDKLQSLIAEDFAYQSLPSVRAGAIVGTPSQVVQALVRALNAGKDNYTLAIYKADGSGGHAITPFAVEDKGAGKLAILVYDNNFPGVVRKVDVDTSANTWHYVGGINPADTSEVYAGDARTRSMFLMPTRPGEGTQPCPFCATKAGANPSPGSFLPSRKHYLEVALLGRGAEHPHLLFVDLKTGLKTGYVKGQLVQQIPGILVNQNLAVQNWRAAPEPTYDIQFGHDPLEVIVDGSRLTRQAVEKIAVNGGGVLFTISAINMEPGQKDVMLLPSDDLGVEYQSNAPFDFSPLLTAEFLSYTNKHTARFVEVFSSRLGYKPGSPYTLKLVPNYGAAVVGSPNGATPSRSDASYELFVATAPIHGGSPPATFSTQKLRFDANTQVAQFPYFNPQGATLPVTVVDKASNKIVRKLQVPRHGPLL